MKPIGVHHVAINVSELGPALAFYVDQLGLELRGDRPDFGIAGAWLDAGSQQIHLLEAPIPSDRGQHFALQVQDLSSVIAELRTAGLEVSDASPSGRGLQAFLRDPSGNLVELQEPVPLPA